MAYKISKGLAYIITLYTITSLILLQIRIEKLMFLLNMWFKEIEHLVDPNSNFLIPISL